MVFLAEKKKDEERWNWLICGLLKKSTSCNINNRVFHPCLKTSLLYFSRNNMSTMDRQLLQQKVHQNSAKMYCSKLSFWQNDCPMGVLGWGHFDKRTACYNTLWLLHCPKDPVLLTLIKVARHIVAGRVKQGRL